MKILNLILRLALGLLLLVFGVNKFVEFLPPFDFKQDVDAAALFQAFYESGYILPSLVGGLEIVVGLLLVTKKWVPFALVALVPLSINIVLFHAVLNPANILPALLVAIINTYLIIIVIDLCFLKR